MKTRMHFLCWLLIAMLTLGALSAAQASTLKMRISTRSGPATEYDETGSFFNKTWQTEQVDVISRSFDGNIWWLQIDFFSGSKHYRTYTGLKRVNIDIDAVPDEAVLGSGVLTADAAAYAGPGKNYVRWKTDVAQGTEVTIYAEENGYVQVEYYESRYPALRRTWVRSKLVNGRWKAAAPAPTVPRPASPAPVPASDRFDLYQSQTNPAVYIGVQHLASGGGTSCIVLHWTKAFQYTNLPVRMTTAKYGTFTTPDGAAGQLWLLDGALMVDLDLPASGLDRVQYLQLI